MDSQSQSPSQSSFEFRNTFKRRRLSKTSQAQTSSPIELEKPETPAVCASWVDHPGYHTIPMSQATKDTPFYMIIPPPIPDSLIRTPLATDYSQARPIQAVVPENTPASPEKEAYPAPSPQPERVSTAADSSRTESQPIQVEIQHTAEEIQSAEPVSPVAETSKANSQHPADESEPTPKETEPETAANPSSPVEFPLSPVRDTHAEEEEPPVVTPASKSRRKHEARKKEEENL
jgi:hypothetical protein